MGDATKCERCGRGTDIERRNDYCSEATIRPLGVTSTVGERECAAIARVRAPLDAEIARLTAEVAALRAKLDDAEMHIDAISRHIGCHEGCDNYGLPCDGPGTHGALTCGMEGEWSPKDREIRCRRHTTREGAEETKR